MTVEEYKIETAWLRSKIKEFTADQYVLKLEAKAVALLITQNPNNSELYRLKVLVNDRININAEVVEDLKNALNYIRQEKIKDEMYNNYIYLCKISLRRFISLSRGKEFVKLSNKYLAQFQTELAL